MAYVSQSILTPAYYEKTLVGSVIRDEESAEMLDIIFSTRVFDVGAYFKVGSYTTTIPSLVNNNKIGTFSSTVQQTARAAAVQLNNINKQFAKAED